MASQISNHLEPWHNLHGKVVLVTGASSGIGRDFSLDLAKAGCKTVAAARRVDRLQSLCDEINQLPPSYSSEAGTESRDLRAVAVKLDVCADGPTIEKSVQVAWDAFGHIDALINNAGVRGNVKSPLELSEEEWNHVFKTNLTGSWLVSKYVCIRMRDAQRKGAIINISSAATVRGLSPGAAAYASSKAALDTLTKVMALELGVHKIRVNGILPGLFKSEITEKLMQKVWLQNVIFKTVPLRTFGTTDPALTSLVRYLIHDSSEYVSGNNFVVDSGTTLSAEDQHIVRGFISIWSWRLSMCQGCATGNVATEDVVYMLNGLGVKTNVDLGKLMLAGHYFISNHLGCASASKAAIALNKSKATAHGSEL